MKMKQKMMPGLEKYHVVWSENSRAMRKCLAASSLKLPKGGIVRMNEIADLLHVQKLKV